MPGDNPMSDPDKDDIWTVSIELPPALGTNYTYTSDACPNWSCKEQIGGQDCAEPPYDDRYLNTGTEDHTVAECFGRCGEGFCGQCPLDSPPPGGNDSCASPQVRVEFFVDMAEAWDIARANVIALQGSFDGDGEGFFPGIVMARVVGTKVFRVGICLDPDTDYAYKFASLEYTNDANEFPNGQYATDATPCPGVTQTQDCEFGTCTARLLHTGDEDMTLEVFPWGGCDGYPFESQ